MARKLPWERLDASARSAPKKPHSSSSAGRRSFSPRASIAGPSNRGSADGDDGRGRPSKRQRSSRPDTHGRYRSPSTSPPPAPPPESFMIDGIDHDDRYRMVEDELLAVARSFTAHLHAAEYQRLRAHAKTQTAAALQSLARPVTVNTTPSARVLRKQAAEKKRAKQKAALRALQGLQGKEGDGSRDDGDDDDDDDDGEKDRKPCTGSALEDLMESDPRKTRPSLVSLTSMTTGRPSSRALNTVQCARPVPRIADSGGIDLDGDEEDDDDLDGPAVESRLPAPTTHAAWPRAAKPTAPEKRSVSFAAETHEITVDRRMQAHVDYADDTRNDEYNDNNADEDEDEDDLGVESLMQNIRRRRAREKAQRQQKQQQKRQVTRAGE